jgi:uncharacterized protein with ParB-like and HNH nuclease domain
MPAVNDLIDIEQHNVKWAIDLMRSNLIQVDNSFQRNYVWLQKHQIKLIETILMGYPIPEIYLWQKETDASTGNTKYSIVDGQQRLGAILNFVNDDFALSSTKLDKENVKQSFSGKKFSQLDDYSKSAIWKFKLSIRLVSESIERDAIVTMFLRLNSTNMTLNPQELRNAEFDGLFLKLADELSENAFWKQHSIFNALDIRRMNDIQFISSILMFFRLGIGEDTTQENFNRVYDLYNEEYKEYDEDKQLFYEILAQCSKIINGEKEIEKFLRKKTHLYSLFLILYYFMRKQGGVQQKQIDRYKLFVDAYNDNAKLTANFNAGEQELINEYKKLSSVGTQSKTNRMRRNDILKQILE